MEIIQDINLLRAFLVKSRRNGSKIGFVPTMGALHNGHFSLINKSLSAKHVTVCSIYVNPTQFNERSDFDQYPRTVDHDIELLKASGCHAVFIPDDHLMYPKPPEFRFDFGEIEHVMEGKYRKGHFNGVATVVSKLFNMVQPDVAYFGQKDYQQFLIIKKLTRTLAFDTQVECVPTIREQDGLAMSSRNVRLSDEDRKIAPAVYRALLYVKQKLEEGKNPLNTEKLISEFLKSFPEIKLEYAKAADAETLEEVKNIHDHAQVIICTAVFLGEIRLIDNVFLFPDKNKTER